MSYVNLFLVFALFFFFSNSHQWAFRLLLFSARLVVVALVIIQIHNFAAAEL
jgi:hypothetical protein